MKRSGLQTDYLRSCDSHVGALHVFFVRRLSSLVFARRVTTSAPLITNTMPRSQVVG